MVEFQQRLRAVYERFEDYRIPELPYLDRIIYTIIPQDGPRTMALRAGNVDFAFNPEYNWMAKVLQGKDLSQAHHLEDEKLWVYAYPNGWTDGIYFNCHEQMDTPFKDQVNSLASRECLF